MTTGVLIFAYNNEHLDYLALANWSAKNIRQHLNLPVCVVTDLPIPSNYHFEQTIYAPSQGTSQRWFADIDKTVPWHNGNRVDAYALTPWEKTLVLDADYVVNSDQLKTLLDVDQDFIAHKTAYDVTGLDPFDDLNNFGRFNMPMWWATVMLFRRSDTTKLIFDTMGMIRNNWDHYRNLYGIGRSTYRNDYSLSIALNIVNGHTLDHAEIPWKLATVTHEKRLAHLTGDRYRVDFQTADQKSRWISITGDFHAMGKGNLGEIVAKSS
jgi:hypothetical protein